MLVCFGNIFVYIIDGNCVFLGIVGFIEFVSIFLKYEMLFKVLNRYNIDVDLCINCIGFDWYVVNFVMVEWWYFKKW